MKIGISSIGYESKELIEKCFVPWHEIKKNKQLIPDIEDLKISFGHGCFEETYNLGFSLYSKDGTCDLIKQQKEQGIIDDLVIYDTPQKEYEMWTNNFLTLKKYDIDLLIMVNVDEIWTLDEIRRMIKYVKNNDLVDYFKINFKNYCIDYSTWVDDFIVPRIWFTKKEPKLRSFYRDDLVDFEDGSQDSSHSHLVIPKNLVFPKHYSWVGSEEYLKRKLNFQSLRYGTCSYAWDDTLKKLKLNEEFYLKYNVPKPRLNKDQE